MLLKKLLPYTVVGAHLPNTLPTQRLENLRVTHQSQVTRRVLSYKSVFFSSTTVPGETFHCSNSFAVIRKEGPAEGLFDKEPAPPPPEIHNSTVPPSSPGHPIEAGIFNASNQAVYIPLVRNQWLEVDDYMEPDPNNVPLVNATAADTLFEGHTWVWDGIDCRSVVSHNQNEPSFKNGWIPQSLSYIDIFLNCLPLKLLRIIILP